MPRKARLEAQRKRMSQHPNSAGHFDIASVSSSVRGIVVCPGPCEGATPLAVGHLNFWARMYETDPPDASWLSVRGLAKRKFRRWYYPHEASIFDGENHAAELLCGVPLLHGEVLIMRK